MGAYNSLYRELGGLEQVRLEGTKAQSRVIDLRDERTLAHEMPATPRS
jgi:hypothetical protein